MTKNLITGICGFVASHLADFLLEKGEEVYGTYRWQEDMSNIQHCKNKIKMIPMDLNDLTSCIKAIDQIRPDYIFHLAAQSYVSDSYTYPIETIRTNTMGTLNLLEAVRIVRDITSRKKDGEGRVSNPEMNYDPVIHVCSSSEVYGLVEEKDIPIKETNLFNPSNPYAVGKVGADMVALMYWTNYKVKTIRTRMFTHTGARRVMKSAEVNFAEQIARIEVGLQEPILRHGNLNSIRTWADVRDAVRAYYLLVRKCDYGDVYNIGGNTTKTIGEMLNYLLSLSPMKEKIKLVQDPNLMRPFDVTLQIPDVSKFKQKTGWEPIYSFEDTMQSLIEFWRKKIITEKKL